MHPVRNYLRVRGEYDSTPLTLRLLEELPPRARRIPVDCPRRFLPPGTTSACAENTPPPTAKAAAQWNYLRVRGEYGRQARRNHSNPELPPRARRIPFTPSTAGYFSGTTSACAENTTASKPQSQHPGNYLRVRGEYSLPSM